MWVMGSNACGQLGTGDKDDRNIPTEIKMSPSKCAAGSNHTLILVGNTVYGCGDNSHGQLAAQEKGCVEFLELYKSDDIIDIFCGWNSSFLTTASEVLATGDNSFGTLGLESKKQSSFTPTGLKEITKISTGMRHTLFLDRHGNVFGCGTARQGTLSLNRNDIVWNPMKIFEKAADIACGQFHSLVLKDGRVYGFGRNKFGQLKAESQFVIDPYEIPIGGMVKSVYSSWSTTAVLTDSGLQMWGRNDFGQCIQSLEPIVDPEEDAVQAAFGSEHGILLVKDKVYTWGWNEHGNCGNGTNLNIAIPYLLNIQAKGICCGGGHSLLF
ncbi:hypothetical protein HDV06_005604 [Boothiomyces sp. JEL0866]|nr:hypothetical protein HDV06_005604 [Boothiomyces sp. JEL0866]